MSYAHEQHAAAMTAIRHRQEGLVAQLVLEDTDTVEHLPKLVRAAAKRGLPVTRQHLIAQVGDPEWQRALLSDAWLASFGRKANPVTTWAREKLLTDHGFGAKRLAQVAAQDTHLRAAGDVLVHVGPGRDQEAVVNVLWHLLEQCTRNLPDPLVEDAQTLTTLLTERGPPGDLGSLVWATTVLVRLGHWAEAQTWLDHMPKGQPQGLYGRSLAVAMIKCHDVEGLERLKARQTKPTSWLDEMITAMNLEVLPFVWWVWPKDEVQTSLRHSTALAGAVRPVGSVRSRERSENRWPGPADTGRTSPSSPGGPNPATGEGLGFGQHGRCRRPLTLWRKRVPAQSTRVPAQGTERSNPGAAAQLSGSPGRAIDVWPRSC